ncbi:ubiquitin-conjugating enzyme subfamily protein [Besnoitia besnoiti]|uniref:Ubiquitin-conjugating enzyme subfamily protein n=1 Tax=Besnoitia besnoiti TaxID=94643 RepID=A0A2A9M572_BESBE|nr:ubiquitin-conjugating enzyme subfamily protein [Besnoitia besnoiti]PFH31451.1 ubiquitin-conjugating enzyme subfamily protein [Besnoitia besnoiti]
MNRDRGGGRGAFLAAGRLSREFALLKRQGGVPYVDICPDIDDLLTWHFVLHDLPADSPYHGGVYHGKLVFPPNYPFAPPSIFMLTPSGRFSVNQRLCMSMSDFHPESWNPSWRLETLVTGFLSFMLDAADPATHGSISTSHAQRRRLALQSFAENKRHKNFATMFPHFVDDSKFNPSRGFSLSGATLAAPAAAGAAPSQLPFSLPSFGGAALLRNAAALFFPRADSGGEPAAGRQECSTPEEKRSEGSGEGGRGGAGRLREGLAAWEPGSAARLSSPAIAVVILVAASLAALLNRWIV